MIVQQLSRCHLPGSATLLALLLLSPLVLCAQTQPPTADQFVGNYKGTAKMDSGEMDVTLEIKSANGKLSGRAVAAGTEYQIASGQIVEGKLALKFGTGVDGASLTLRQSEDKLVGDWISGAQKGTVELKKIAAEPSTAEFLTGEWDATADANGQPFPFTLNLKVDGEKVTGTSNSEMGTSTVTSGSWKDGKLVFVLDSANGQIGMVAAIVDGKLVGDFDLSGQMTGKWAAVKKKP
jgi:hypothetical protein